MVIRVAGAGFFLLLGVWGCDRVPPPTPIDQTVRPAHIYEVNARRAEVRHTFVGRVEASQTVDLSFEVGGRLLQLPVREGQSIPRGTLVAALDSTDFALAVREAEVAVRLARQDLERKRRLIAERGTAQSVVDDAQAAYELKLVALERARDDLADAELHAPFDAYVARRYVDAHVLVRPGDPIVRLLDLEPLYVVVNVPESLVATVTPERVIAVDARFAFAPGRRFPLTFYENRGESSAVAQTFEVTFTMKRPEDLNVLPGMTATVDLLLAGSTPAQFVVPTGALVADSDDGFSVWRFDPVTGAVERLPVQLGPPVDDGITVLGGLAPGDLIVASGAEHLREGMKVRPLDDGRSLVEEP